VGTWKQIGQDVVVKAVSIQLVSPASGDKADKSCSRRVHEVSIQLVSPASGDGRMVNRSASSRNVSIQLVSPASGDLKGVWPFFPAEGKFPFN